MQGAEPGAVVAQVEVDADDPFEAVAAGRGEQQPCGEERVGDEPLAQFPQDKAVAHMVEVEAEQAAVPDKAVILAVAEGSREAHEVEVRSLEFAGLLGVVDGAERVGGRQGGGVERKVFVDPLYVGRLIRLDGECRRSEE